MGAEGFVEKFVPRTTWPEPRSVSPEIYRAAMESLLESEEEDPVFVRRSRQRRE